MTRVAPHTTEFPDGDLLPAERETTRPGRRSSSLSVRAAQTTL